MTQRGLVLLLGLGAVMTGSAFLAVMMPAGWMAAAHEWLGMGAYPHAPVVDYLARSVAALYGFHGILLFLLSLDVQRYRLLVWYVAAMNVVFGLMLVAIGGAARLPRFWIVVEGPSIATTGLVIGWLNWRLAREHR